MLQQTDTLSLSLSPAAAQAVQNILTERNLEGYALRVYVSGGGCCSGTQFGMALDNNTYANDTAVMLDGVKVIVDETSLPYLRGARIDFVNDPTRGAGFLVDSPNAQQGGGSCSCGSGAHAEDEHEHAEGGCACGGSCSCNN